MGPQAPYHVSIVCGEGDCESVGHLICQKADHLHAALIAMAAHNKGRLIRFMVGSTTQVRHCWVPMCVAAYDNSCSRPRAGR